MTEYRGLDEEDHNMVSEVGSTTNNGFVANGALCDRETGQEQITVGWPSRKDGG